MDVMTCTWCEDEQAVVQGNDEHNGPWSLCKTCLRDLVDTGAVWNEAGHIQRAALRAIDAGVLDAEPLKDHDPDVAVSDVSLDDTGRFVR